MIQPPGGRSARARLVLALLCGLLLASACRPELRPDAGRSASVTIRGTRVAVEIARTPEQQQLGLGRRDRLDWDTGMLFLYDEPGFYAFWMKEMRFDIDIVWIRGERIIGVSHRVPHPGADAPGGNGPTLRPPELVDRVLEVPAGYAEAHRWGRGDRVLVAGVEAADASGS